MQAWDIEFRSLTVGYGEHVVLRDINAVLPAGKVSVILGGSGGGKSTLLRHIIGLSRPISGSVLIGGRDLFKLGTREFRRVRRQMGVLFQDGALLGALSLAQNVALPLSEHLHLPKPLIREAALRVLRMVGLEEFADFFPNQLSGGMRKRAGLARRDHCRSRAFCSATSPRPAWIRSPRPAWTNCCAPCMNNTRK